jgi:hypothetical protein
MAKLPDRPEAAAPGFRNDAITLPIRLFSWVEERYGRRATRRSG